MKSGGKFDGLVSDTTTMDEKKFLRAYQTIKFQENSADCYSLAGYKRSILALSYHGSLQLNEDNDVTEFLLNEGLKEYAEIVDNKNPGGVNNYAGLVLSLLGNCQNDDKKHWKSNLEHFKLKEHLHPLPCSNTLKCRNSECLPEFSKDLKEIFDQFEEENKQKNTAVFNLPRNDHTRERKNSLDSSMNTPRKPQPTGAQNTSTNQSPYHEEVPKAKETFYFRTARDELQIQNAKKFGGKNSNANEKLNNGPVKKSLGTRKGGVFGKFQPPTRSNENKEDGQLKNNKMDGDEEVDERLKNIDANMIETIKNEIMDSGSKITWDDIAGLHLAKSTIQEIVVWPMLRPDIFTGLRRPPKGILLFGPPGTGKTLIGKCIASQSNSTFFSISASSLTSKWVGDGEKMVRTLFAVAKVYQPSVVFIDEIDSLLTQRSDSDHECSRRIKTEFLVQLDGAGTGDEDRILIIGATNRPQELDEAARRRLVKRLYIPLPDEEARKQIIENLISSERHSLTEPEIENIAKLTKGYSGADVKNLCQEASLGPIRSISPAMIQSINPSDVRPLNAKDFESALSRIKSSVSEKDLDIYLAWDKQYGCGSALS